MKAVSPAFIFAVFVGLPAILLIFTCEYLQEKDPSFFLIFNRVFLRKNRP